VPALTDVLADLEDRLGAARGEPVALDGGLTNRNYRVRLGGGDYVVRLPGEDTAVLGIDRDVERAAAEAAAAAGIGPDVVAFARGCLVTRWVEARPLTGPEVARPELLAAVAGALRAIHAGPPMRSTFRGVHVGEAYRAATLERGGRVPAAYDEAHALIARIDAALAGPDHEPVPCHNDLLPANLLWDGRRLTVVDWDYAGMGDRTFDLGNLAVNCGFGAAEEEALVAAYFGAPDPRRLAAVRLQRLVSDFREAMWGVLQAAVSTLDVDYGAYAQQHFDRLAAAAKTSPVDAWLEEVARAA
jgi:thiamine kinase-like enzyme